MVVKEITTESDTYIAKVKEYTYESFVCSLYKKNLLFPKKIYEKIFLRKLVGNSATEMINSTVHDYEWSKLKP